MMQSLSVVRSGLEGAQTKMDVISNNLANINTTGFKKMRPIFNDLLYQNTAQAGGFTSQATNAPSGLQQGTGAKCGRTLEKRASIVLHWNTPSLYAPLCRCQD